MASPLFNNQTNKKLLEYAASYNAALPRTKDKRNRNTPDRKNWLHQRHINMMQVIIKICSAHMRPYLKTGAPVKEYSFLTNNMQLATECGCHYRTAARQIKTLVKAKLLKKQNRGYMRTKEGVYKYQDFRLILNNEVIVMLTTAEQREMHAIYTAQNKKQQNAENHSTYGQNLTTCLYPSNVINNKIMLSESLRDSNNNLSKKAENDVQENVQKIGHIKDAENDDRGTEPVSCDETARLTTHGEHPRSNIANALLCGVIMWNYCAEKLFGEYKFIAPKQKEHAITWFQKCFVNCHTQRDVTESLEYWISAVDKARDLSKRFNFKIPLPTFYFNKKNKWGFVKVLELLERDIATDPEREINREFVLVRKRQKDLAKNLSAWERDQDITKHYLRCGRLYRKDPQEARDYIGSVEILKQKVA
jgi:hypothetical protein